jgi:hypothetical protein
VPDQWEENGALTEELGKHILELNAALDCYEEKE